MGALSGHRTLAAAAAVATALTLLMACGGDRAPQATSPHVEVRDAWARPTPPGTTVAAVYLTLRADVDDALVAVDVDPVIAAGATVHENATLADGTTRMQELPALRLPAGEDVAIEPTGYHVMVEGLAAPLEVGAAFEVTFEFEHAPAVAVDVVVSEAAP